MYRNEQCLAHGNCSINITRENTSLKRLLEGWSHSALSKQVLRSQCLYRPSSSFSSAFNLYSMERVTSEDVVETAPQTCANRQAPGADVDLPCLLRQKGTLMKSLNLSCNVSENLFLPLPFNENLILCI